MTLQYVDAKGRPLSIAERVMLSALRDNLNVHSYHNVPSARDMDIEQRALMRRAAETISDNARAMAAELHIKVDDLRQIAVELCWLYSKPRRKRA